MTDARTQSYPDFVSFYRAVYGSSIGRVSQTAVPGVFVIDAEQGAGNWSDAPTPDLVITKLVRGPSPSTMDLGAGRFRGTIQIGNGIVAPPETATSIYMEAPHVLHALSIPYVILLDLAPDQDLPSDGDFRSVHRGAFTDPFVYAVSDALWQEARSGNPRGRLFADAALITIATTLRHLADAPMLPAIGGLAAWQLRRTTDHLQDRLAEAVTLKELASIARLSVYHFCRAFKTSTGYSPHRYQTELRIERAKTLLGDTNLSVTDIAPLVGYETPQAFSRMFRRAVGTPPTDYRRLL